MGDDGDERRMRLPVRASDPTVRRVGRRESKIMLGPIAEHHGRLVSRGAARTSYADGGGRRVIGRS